MEIKKNPKADLEKRSGLFLNIGLCVSLLLVITAFQWRFYDRGAGMDLGSIEDDFEDLMEIPPMTKPSHLLDRKCFYIFLSYSKF